MPIRPGPSRPAGRLNRPLTSASGTSSAWSAGWPPRPATRRRRTRGRPRAGEHDRAGCGVVGGGCLAGAAGALAGGDGLAGLRPLAACPAGKAADPGTFTQALLQALGASGSAPKVIAGRTWRPASGSPAGPAAQAPGILLPRRRPALADLVAQRDRTPRSPDPSWCSRPVTPTS